jgi:hypothetical protein
LATPINVPDSKAPIYLKTLADKLTEGVGEDYALGDAS